MICRSEVAAIIVNRAAELSYIGEQCSLTLIITSLTTPVLLKTAYCKNYCYTSTSAAS